MHVDLDSPRVSLTEGEPAFLPHGGITEYLERINSILFTIHEGLQSNVGFVDALLKHELLESFVFDIELDDGSRLVLDTGSRVAVRLGGDQRTVTLAKGQAMFDVESDAEPDADDTPKFDPAKFSLPPLDGEDDDDLDLAIDDDDLGGDGAPFSLDETGPKTKMNGAAMSG